MNDGFSETLLLDAPSKTPTHSIEGETHANRQKGFLLPALLSMTAGAVDVISFLGFGGLFTAHITGNLVILAAHYITGRFGEIAPVLSVPVFVLVLGVVTEVFVRKPIPFIRRALLFLQAVLLASLLGLGVGFGPFAYPENLQPATLTLPSDALAKLDAIGTKSEQKAKERN